MALPWWAKMGAKLLLTRLNIPYGFWRRMGLFRHGAMDDPAHAQQVFATHFAAYESPAPDFTCLELGCGDALSTALLARRAGAGRTILVDAGDFAAKDAGTYAALAAALGDAANPTPPASRDDYLRANAAIYLTEGLASLRELPDACADFVFSNAVLEHIRRDEFADTMRELRRIQRPGGVGSHQVDFRDHLGGGRNNLRFGDAFWERPGVAAAGFYTNRIAPSEMLEHFDACGFAVTVRSTSHHDGPPLPRRALHPQFHHVSDDDLRIAGYHVVLH